MFFLNEVDAVNIKKNVAKLKETKVKAFERNSANLQHLILISTVNFRIMCLIS